MPIEAGKIRNVAVVGHRGTGKTSLVEAMLFQAGKTNRLGHGRGGHAPSPTGTRTSSGGRCRCPRRSRTASGRAARST